MDSNLFMAVGRRVAAALALLLLAACATPAPPVQRAAISKPPVAPKPAVAPELPPANDSELSSELTLHLDAKLLEALRELAEAQDKSIAEVVREILSEALAGPGPWRAQLKEPD